MDFNCPRLAKSLLAIFLAALFIVDQLDAASIANMQTIKVPLLKTMGRIAQRLSPGELDAFGKFLDDNSESNLIGFYNALAIEDSVQTGPITAYADFTATIRRVAPQFVGKIENLEDQSVAGVLRHLDELGMVLTADRLKLRFTDADLANLKGSARELRPSLAPNDRAELNRHMLRIAGLIQGQSDEGGRSDSPPVDMDPRILHAYAASRQELPESWLASRKRMSPSTRARELSSAIDILVRARDQFPNIHVRNHAISIRGTRTLNLSRQRAPSGKGQDASGFVTFFCAGINTLVCLRSTIEKTGGPSMVIRTDYGGELARFQLEDPAPKKSAGFSWINRSVDIHLVFAEAEQEISDALLWLLGNRVLSYEILFLYVERLSKHPIVGPILAMVNNPPADLGKPAISEHKGGDNPARSASHWPGRIRDSF